jgi:two-component system NtrC family sensor kinase
VEVEIKDNGTGIATEIQDRIFDPFFTTKQPGEGTGLGLSISHSLMQQLGGAIDFESTPGQGTTFRLTLPKNAF